MSTLLLTALLAAADVSAPSPTSVEVFTAPPPTLAGMAFGAAGLLTLHVPVGVTIRLNDAWGLTAEVDGTASIPKGAFAPGWSVGASVGPTWFAAGRGMQGFFFTTKVLVRGATAPEEAMAAIACGPGFPCPPPAPTSSFAALLAADAGYEWRWDRLSLSTVLGFGVGYQESQGTSLTQPLPLTATGHGFAWTMNFDFLRVGYAF